MLQIEDSEFTAAALQVRSRITPHAAYNLRRQCRVRQSQLERDPCCACRLRGRHVEHHPPVPISSTGFGRLILSGLGLA
jgi:hypothetical protein